MRKALSVFFCGPGHETTYVGFGRFDDGADIVARLGRPASPGRCPGLTCGAHAVRGNGNGETSQLVRRVGLGARPAHALSRSNSLRIARIVRSGSCPGEMAGSGRRNATVAGARCWLGCARVVREQSRKTAPLAPLYQSERVKSRADPWLRRRATGARSEQGCLWSTRVTFGRHWFEELVGTVVPDDGPAR